MTHIRVLLNIFCVLTVLCLGVVAFALVGELLAWQKSTTYVGMGVYMFVTALSFPIPQPRKARRVRNAEVDAAFNRMLAAKDGRGNWPG